MYDYDHIQAGFAFDQSKHSWANSDYVSYTSF